MKKLFVFIGILFHWFWKFLTTGSSLIMNLLFLAFLIMVLSLFIKPQVKVPEGSALILAPDGDLVEKKTVIDPLSRIINGSIGIPLPEETLLQDILDVIDKAAGDDRIKLIVMDLDELNRASLDQIRTIGKHLQAFRQSGKQVITFGNHFQQGHYYLASYADEIYLNPLGSINLWGFGVFRLYLKELIDRLAINFHVFKVGSFKSALEPFTRNSMSADAKAANEEWLNRLWSLFCDDISKNRDFAPDFITDYINEMPSYLKRAGGSSANMALLNGLVDGLKTRSEAEDYLINFVGRAEKEKTFRQIHFLDYLSTFTPSYTTKDPSRDNIAIIVAQGNIVYGEIVPGQINSEDLGKLIRHAREEKSIKAVVLRIDSGGGSAFASEQIRQELLHFQKSGKPVVVSMGSLAASGAYWISATADRIFASPFTLTGSIGIYGMLPTFENSLTKIGMASDGIGTTKMAGAGDPTRGLPPELIESIQLNVEEGYDRFINIVAEGREMDHDRVNRIAQGRVWDGAKAKGLGLVDEMGGLNESIQAAAKLAELDEYNPVYLHHVLPQTGDLLEYISSWSQETMTGLRRFPFGDQKITRNIKEQMSSMVLRGDPANVYAHSLIPSTSFSF